MAEGFYAAAGVDIPSPFLLRIFSSFGFQFCPDKLVTQVLGSSVHHHRWSGKVCSLLESFIISRCFCMIFTRLGLAGLKVSTSGTLSFLFLFFSTCFV